MKKQESQISDGTAELSKLKDSHIDANLASENLHTTPRANSESVKRNPLLISGIEDNESFYYTAGSTTSNQPVVVAQVREDNQKSLGSTTEL